MRVAILARLLLLACGSDKKVCTYGQDQTCNDIGGLSSFHGTCNSDGTCSCNSGNPKNPATGKCF